MRYVVSVLALAPYLGLLPLQRTDGKAPLLARWRYRFAPSTWLGQDQPPQPTPFRRY